MIRKEILQSRNVCDIMVWHTHTVKQGTKGGDGTQSVEHLVACTKPWVLSLTLRELGVVEHAHNPNTQDMEARDQEFKVDFNDRGKSRLA